MAFLYDRLGHNKILYLFLDKFKNIIKFIFYRNKSKNYKMYFSESR